MVWQRREEQPEYIKGVLRLGGQVRSDITVDQGNHGFRDAKGQPLPSVALEDIALLHLPVRNSDQIIAKGVLGWKANQARADATAESAYQWKRINDLFESGQTVLDNQILAQEAMAYAQTTETPVWSANALPWQGAIVKNRSYSDGQSAPFDTLLKAGVEIPAMRYQPGDRLVDSDAESHISHAFDDQWHWDHFFLDIPPFQFIAEKYQIKSCLDVGCGTGALLDYLKFMGISDILGADGISRESTILSADEFRREDLEKPLNLGRTFDLVFCLEVVEHVEPAATKTVIDTIARHARDLIVFSMAEPGQPGNQHINCLSMSDVLDIWADKGWVPVIPDTLAIRAISTLSWFRRNLLVLQRADKVAEPVDDQVLRSIGGLAYEWYGQTGGIRRAPFDEALQPVGNGYW